MTPEHSHKRQRIAAAAAFLGFWAALLVTIGFPLALVAVGWILLVGGLVAALEGRPAVAGIAPRARTVREGLSRLLAAATARAERIDWTGLRARAARAQALVARDGRGAVASTRRATQVASTRAAAVARAAGAAADGQAQALRRQVAGARERRAAYREMLRLNAEAAALRQQGAADRALEAGEQALAFSRRLGDRRAEALTLNGIGLAQARSGDEAGAVDSYETAIAILTSLGESHGAGRVLANLGALHLDRGDEDEARARWNDALERLEPDSPEHARTAEQLRLAG